MPGESVTILEAITQGSIITVLAIALIGGMRGWYVWGHTHEKELKAKDEVIADKNDQIKKAEQDRDYWRNISVRVLTANEKTLAKIEDLTQKV